MWSSILRIFDKFFSVLAGDFEDKLSSQAPASYTGGNFPYPGGFRLGTVLFWLATGFGKSAGRGSAFQVFFFVYRGGAGGNRPAEVWP
jgi:hypothetical protein